MSDNISTETRSLFYFNDMKSNVIGVGDRWMYIYALTLILGTFLISFLCYQINLYSEERKYDQVNSRVWYIVINVIVA